MEICHGRLQIGQTIPTKSDGKVKSKWSMSFHFWQPSPPHPFLKMTTSRGLLGLQFANDGMPQNENFMDSLDLFACQFWYE